MKSKWKLPVILGCIISLSGCGISNQPAQKTASEQKSSTAEENVRTGSWESAAQSPYGAYPELVTYTLGQRAAPIIPIFRMEIPMKIMPIPAISKRS